MSSTSTDALRARATPLPVARPTTLSRGRWAPLVAAGIGSLLVLPSVVWAALDKSIWWWDQSRYGESSIRLWLTLRLDPSSWWHVMLGELTSVPPATMWLGQAFVPLRNVAGSVETSLLLSVDVAAAVCLALLFAACVRVAEGRILPALAGTLLTAGAPLFMNITHWYLVEPLQTASVAWVLWIMASARRWHLSLTSAQLAAAITFGVLAKLSTPVYVAAPAAVALLVSFLVGRGRPLPRWWLDRRFLASVALTGGLLFLTAEWYARNFHVAWAHAQLSANSTLWGTEGSFTSHLSIWLGRLGDAVFLPYFGIAVGAVLLAGAALTLARKGRPSLRGVAYPLLLLAGCLGSPIAALALLSSQVNSDPRFLFPAIPAIGLACAVVLRRLGGRLVAAALALVFVAQFGLMTAQSFANSVPGTYSGYRSLPVAKSPTARRLDAIVRRVCLASPPGSIEAVGTSYFWLNANTLNFLAIKEFAQPCPWAAVGGHGTTVDGAWQDLVRYRSPFFLTVDYGNPRNPLPPQIRAKTPLDDRFNRTDRGLFRRVLGSGRYVVVPGSRRLGLILLRLART